MTIKEIDLDSNDVRRDYNFEKVNGVVDSLNDVSAFPSLVWVWTWDIVRNMYENGGEDWNEHIIPEGVTLKQIWDKLWLDADRLGFSMDSGGEVIEETIRDWMVDNNFMIIEGDEDEDE